MDTGMVVSARRRRVTRLLASLTLIIASGTPSASLALEPSPKPSASAEVVHGWVGPRGGPAGLHSWSVGDLAWMHNVSVEGSGPVEMTFGTLEGIYRIPMDDIGPAGDEHVGPYPDVPEQVVDVRLQAWLLDVDGTRVLITVKSFPDTAPGLVTEAEAIVDSVRIGPGRLLVFELPGGWDSG
jgi:hypothetical protein